MPVDKCISDTSLLAEILLQKYEAEQPKTCWKHRRKVIALEYPQTPASSVTLSEVR